MQVSSASIAFMALSGFVAVALPFAIFIFLKVKYKAKFVPFLVGAAAFIVFALVLEQLVHAIVLRQGSATLNFMSTRPLLYMLYGGLMAGIFEETARLVCFLLLKKRYTGVENALSYGAGHGGIEAIILMGLGAVNNIVAAVMINAGTYASLPGVTPELAQAATTALAGAPPYQFAVGGLERVFAICIQMCLSVLVYYAVMAKGEMWLYPVAIALHAAVDFPAVLYQRGVITNIYLVEAIVAAFAVLLVLLAVYVHKKLRDKVAVPVAPVAAAAVPDAGPAATGAEELAPPADSEDSNG